MAEKDYVLLKDNVVVNTIILDDPTQETIDLFKNEYDADRVVLLEECRGNVQVGAEFDNGTFFIDPQPSQYYIKDYDLGIWTEHIPRPDDQNPYIFNGETGVWDLVEIQPEQ
jgi:hypothetical protein